MWLRQGEEKLVQGPTSPALDWLNFGLPEDSVLSETVRSSSEQMPPGYNGRGFEPMPPGYNGPFGHALFPPVPLHDLRVQSESRPYYPVLATDVVAYDLDTSPVLHKLEDKDPQPAPTGPPPAGPPVELPGTQAKPFKVTVAIPGGGSPSLAVVDRTTIVWNVASQKASSSDHMAVSPPFRLSEASVGDFVFVLVAVPGSARTTPSFKRSRGRVRVQLKSRASGDDEILQGFLSFRISVGATEQCKTTGTEMTHSFASNALCECPTVWDLSSLAAPACPIPIRLEMPSH